MIKNIIIFDKMLGKKLKIIIFETNVVKSS